MPPKRAGKKTAPSRRSARIRSREASVETETVSQADAAVVVSPPQRSPSPPPFPAVETAKKYSRVRREFFLQNIHAEDMERQAAEQRALLPATYPTPSRQPAWPGPPATSPKQQEAAEVAEATSAPSSAEQHAGWRKMLTSFGGYLVSPWARKRPAEEDDASPPSNKRVRIEEPVAEKVADEAPSSPPTPDIAMRAQETPGEPLQRAQETPATTEKAQETPATIARQGRTPGSAQQSHSQPAHTPHSAHKNESPRDYAGPSAKDPKMPTSLSTITEYTEPSFLSNLSQLDSNTPTKPSRVQPQPMMLDDPQITPLHPHPSTSLQTRPNTPRRTLMGTPVMRRAAQLRAARAAAETGIPSSASIFSTQKRAPPKPKETNADARQAKLERMRALQKELEELQQDEDIKEMQSHRRKRVKIDNLVSIPHNLPGDPSGMFRVPEGDSDDEMEVYDDVEERSNVFEEAETRLDASTDVRQSPLQRSAQQTPVSTPLQKSMGMSTSSTMSTPVSGIMGTPVPAVSSTPQYKPASTPKPPVSSTPQPSKPTAPQQESVKYTDTETGMVFQFPNVGRIPEGYHVSDEFKADALKLFQDGLAEWVANN